jgi:DNA-directed RNA polymerase specialized sigma24 family protein
MSDASRAGFASLYRATLAPLRRYLARLLGNTDDAHDLAHDAYARVFKAVDTKRVEKPEEFLFTTARRLALNQIKRRQAAAARIVAGETQTGAAGRGP